MRNIHDFCTGLKRLIDRNSGDLSAEIDTSLFFPRWGYGAMGCKPIVASFGAVWKALLLDTLWGFVFLGGKLLDPAMPDPSVTMQLRGVSFSSREWVANGTLVLSKSAAQIQWV